jgi:hypothetical protein
MKIASALALTAALVATAASAQGVNLSGRFLCVQLCEQSLEGQPAFITQNGWNLNLLNEAGEPSRAWVDWVGHIWVDRWNEGAIYSPDGMTVQFDRGTVWQRDVGEPTFASQDLTNNPTIKRRRGIAAPVRGIPAPVVRIPVSSATSFDGGWSVVIMTQSGACDRAYRYGVQISNGNVSNNGGEPVSLQGHVAPNGAIHVSVSSGGQQAEGEGRMSRNTGNGTWHGQGSGGTCAGAWQAERRG